MTNTINSMIPKMSGAIALRPTGNAQGSYYFLSLHSVKCIIRNNWTVLPMPAEVIATDHQLANACKKYTRIVFTDRQGNIINDALTSDEYQGADDTNEDMDDITGVYDNETHHKMHHEITGVHNNEVTGVHNNNEVTGMHNETNGNTIIETEIKNGKTDVTHEINDIVTHEINDIHETNGNTETRTNDKVDDNDDISIKLEDHDNNHVTIDDLNFIEQMYAAQMKTDPKLVRTCWRVSGGMWLIMVITSDPIRRARTANMPWHRMVNNQLRLRWQNLTHT